nr:hypothetical protein [Tanacetum cinerariifolium]
MNEFKGRMPTKIELTLEQSQQGVSYDVLVAVCSSLRVLKPNAHKLSLEPTRDQIINLIRTQEVSFDEDVDEWLNAEMSKRMTGHDKVEEEDALIDILKTVVEEFIDTLEGPNETMLLGRSFLATIHSQIDVFRGEILLGLGNEKVKFDTNGEICHSRVFHENIYMASSIQKDHERQSVKGNGMKFTDFLKVRNFEVYKEKFDDEIKQLENEYELKAGRKRYALEEVWEKCKKFHDSTKQWYAKGFKEEELWQNGIEEMDYTPSLVKSETFEIYRYTFKNRKSFISITKQMEDILTLGRVNGSKFIEKTRREMDEEGEATRKM